MNDNGQKIEIRDQDGEDIEVTVTETVNGQDETSEYSADDLDDLKQNHPDIAELYEKYTQQNPIQFQVFAAQCNRFRICPDAPSPFRSVPISLPRVTRICREQKTYPQLSNVLSPCPPHSSELKDSEDADKDVLEELVQELNSALEELAETRDELDD